MSRRANPKLVGGFVLAAIGLAVAAALVFGSFTVFEPTRKFIVFFQGTVDGLAQGSQVLFRGVPVGKVVDIGIRYDPRDSSFAIPVIIEIRPGVIAKYSPPAATLSAEGVRRLIDEGLRARLETSSLVTGQQVVQLNFFPGTPGQTPTDGSALLPAADITVADAAADVVDRRRRSGSAGPDQKGRGAYRSRSGDPFA